jgi:hypothetical protein
VKLIRIPAGNWRPDNRQLFHFGTYRVPEDMPEDLARRAVAEGVAEDITPDSAPAIQRAAVVPATAAPKRKPQTKE